MERMMANGANEALAHEALAYEAVLILLVFCMG